MGFFDFVKKLISKSEDEEKIELMFLTQKSEETADTEYRKLRAEAYNLFDSLYDTNTVDGIKKIPVPEYVVSKYKDFTCKPEYILDLRATAHKRDGNIELAVECLRKANELRVYSDFMYSEKNFNRLVEYLKFARRFDEAKEEEKKIKHILSAQNENIKKRREQLNDRLYGEFNSDLVEVSYINSCCSVCAKYRGRVFSVKGVDKRFPLFPKDFHEDCGLRYSPFVFGVSCPVYCGKDEVIEFSNKPFIDDRTEEQKEGYNRILQEKAEDKQREIDKLEYDWLWENIPEICPKTFNAYQRMKKANSTGYIKIQEQKLHWLKHKN